MKYVGSRDYKFRIKLAGISGKKDTLTLQNLNGVPRESIEYVSFIFEVMEKKKRRKNFSVSARQIFIFKEYLMVCIYIN